MNITAKDLHLLVEEARINKVKQDIWASEKLMELIISAIVKLAKEGHNSVVVNMHKDFFSSTTGKELHILEEKMTPFAFGVNYTVLKNLAKRGFRFKKTKVRCISPYIYSENSWKYVISIFW